MIEFEINMSRNKFIKFLHRKRWNNSHRQDYALRHKHRQASQTPSSAMGTQKDEPARRLATSTMPFRTQPTTIQQFETHSLGRKRENGSFDESFPSRLHLAGMWRQIQPACRADK